MTETRRLKAKVSYGRVENVGNYRSFRLSVTVEFDLTTHSFEESAENLIKRLDRMVEEKKQELMES
jgi:stalled ribosome rescue protein Dom34